jgi:hypothetical protein
MARVRTPGGAAKDGTQAGSGRSQSRQHGKGPQGAPKAPTQRRRRDTVADQARELRPLGMEGPVEAALTPPISAPEHLRGPNPEDRFAPLRAEHAEVDARLEELWHFVGPDEERVTRWTRIATALETHARAEEWELYPRLRRNPVTKAMAGEALLQHTRMRELVREIDGKQVDDPEYRALLGELAGALRQHVALEEQILLPLAQQAIGKAEVDRLVAAWVRQRRRLEPAVADERVRPGRPGKRTGRSAAKMHRD